MVVASLFKAGKPHFHTNGGELANGYHLFVYDAQTNNPANLYMDAKGKFPYPNPIVLNSRGEPNGDGLYGIVGRKYKLIYKDFTNKTIYTIDEIIVSNVESIGIEDTPDDDILYGRQNGEWKEIPLSELSETVILEYGDDSTFDDVLAMLNAGKRVLVNVDPFYSNNNAIGSDGVQKYPISPYKVLLQGNIPTGNPYIDFTGYVGGSVVQVSHVQLWNSSAPSMPSKINNWCVNDTNPTELAKKSELTALTSRVNALEENGGGAENEMLVTFIESTPNTYPTDITQSVDKTFAEIKAAYDSGLSVYATAKITYSAGTDNETTQKDNTRIPLVSADDSMIVFEQTIARSYPTATTRNYSVQYIQYTLLSDNTWTRTYEGKNLTDEFLILNFDSDENLGKTLNNNSTKPLKILRLNTNSEGSHFMDLNLIDSSVNLFGGVGLVEGVLSYVQVRIGYNGITDETITEKTITPLQTVSEV